jgi:hypothetical protein
MSQRDHTGAPGASGRAKLSAIAMAGAMPLPLVLVPWRRRLPSLASVVYVGVLSIWTDGGREPAAWLGAAAALAVALVAARRRARAARAVGWGLAVVLASLGANRDSRALDACGALGLLAVIAGACVALVAIPSDGGMVRVEPSSPVAGVVAVTVAWWVAIVAAFAPDRSAVAWMADYSRTWAEIALATSAFVLVTSTELTLRRRRLELGVIERGGAIRSVIGTLMVAAALVALLGHLRAEGVARLALALAGALVAGAALHPDPVWVARIARRTVALAIVGGGAALAGASAAEGAGDAWQATIVTAAVALAIGSSAAALDAPLRPEGGAWLDAFARAADEPIRADPDDAIREALLALRAPSGLNSPSPELWTFAPGLVATVDAAGYLHERVAELPETLALIAGAEPEGTVRAEVLDALEVRRPELRPLARWMTDRGAMLATVVACDGETEGLLVLPRGKRNERPTLEEVRALKRVADRLAAFCRARGTRSRMLARERDAAARAEAAEDRVERIRHARALDVGRDALAASRLARPATVGVYSAASRMALEALERRTSFGAPLAVVSPSGVDPVPFLARAHLAGARADGPLVLVDATSAREHDLERWRDPRVSPLALADRGMLVLLDGAALPWDVQHLVARTCAEKRPPWERPESLDFQLALTSVADPDDLVAEGRLAPGLALRLGDARSAPIILPRLRDRPEDLRAIVTDRLAREGLRVLGRPIGIEHAAYARLAQYTFPGEDAELSAIVTRLVSRCQRDVVGPADVDALRLETRLENDDPKSRKDPLSA